MLRQPLLGILLATVAWVAVPVRPVAATTIAVTTTTDELNTDGDCSLREAIRAANTNAAVDACPAGKGDQTDTITVPAGTYTLTLAGNDDAAAVGDLDLRDNTAVDDLVVTGAGAATTIIQACAVEQLSANCPAGQGVADRVLNVIDAHVAISGVTIRHGRAPNSGGTRVGSGIWIQRFDTQPALTLTDVVVTKNGDTVVDIDSDGGGIANWLGVLTLTRVTVSDNGANGGGGISNKLKDDINGYNAVLLMTDSTLSGNVAAGGGGGLLNSAGATATLTGCTINDNDAYAGGGIQSDASATLTNCTISGNQARAGGGGGINNGGGPMNLRSSTVTANRLIAPSQGAGGIFGSSVVLRNTIVAGNFDDGSGGLSMAKDCNNGLNFTIVSEGYSLVGDGSRCAGLDGAINDQIGTKEAPIDAKLGPLADNGGPTLTHALLSGSPAIDGANPATPGSGGTACPTTDQRGETRPSGAACDVGSVERGGGGGFAATAVEPKLGGTAGTVQVRVYGDGFVAGAVVRLVRAGFADVVGTATSVLGTVATTSLDLRDAAPGAWSVEIENPDASVATLIDAFTVVAGGGADLWSQVVVPRRFLFGRTQTIYLLYGNRGTVDAEGVPIWLSFSDALHWEASFSVTLPPVQPGQIATDWTKVAISVRTPPPEINDTFPLLLPVVPAGSTGVLKMRVASPLAGPAVPALIHVTADIGTPYFAPDLSPAVVAEYVSRAKAYAVKAHEPTTFASDAAIETYVRTQLAAVVAEGRIASGASVGGDPPVSSQALLLVDTGQFIAGESQTASWALGDRHWLARIVSDLVSAPAEAAHPCDAYKNPREVDFCEQEIDPCRHGCKKDPPIIKCDRVNIINDDEFIFVPCKPKPQPPDDDTTPLVSSFDPNDKVGPGGPGGFIDGVTPLPYVISFENLATASAEAFEVTVTDQLDVAKYDLDTFSLGPISFADNLVPVPPGLKSFSTEVDLRPGANILVGIDAALDAATGIVRWKFTTLDPATHEFPENPEDGFLPPNVTSPEGEGAVLFTVSLKPGFGLGTTVCNDAHIVFDFNAPIDTPEFCNTIGAPEDCENCVDDDGDGKIDRADADCPLPANGAGAGADTAAAKAVDKCAKAIRKVGAKLTSNRLKQLGACEKAVADCVQLKANAPACLLKAQKPCTKARTGLPAAETKLTEAIIKACGEPTLAKENLFAAVGVGFDGEVAACGQRGLDSVDTTAEVAECVRQQHVCAAGRLLGAAVPRARELLVLGGFEPAELACVPSGANGGGAALAADKQKAIRKCDAAIQKATAKLAAGRAKAGQACGGALFTCVQTKPGEPCLTKAGGACTKGFAALPKLAQGFAATIEKACGAAPLVPADLLASDGLGVSALAETCATLGVASLTTVENVTTCLDKQIKCSADHLLENETPRLGELLGLGHVVPQ